MDVKTWMLQLTARVMKIMALPQDCARFNLGVGWMARS
jgi:hypothetical protein